MIADGLFLWFAGLFLWFAIATFWGVMYLITALFVACIFRKFAPRKETWPDGLIGLFWPGTLPMLILIVLGYNLSHLIGELAKKIVK